MISPNAFNDHAEDLVLVAITSQEPDDRAVAIGPGDCVDGMLPKSSSVKVAKLFTMHSTLVLKPICVLRQEKLAEVLHELRAFPS